MLYMEKFGIDVDDIRFFFIFCIDGGVCKFLLRLSLVILLCFFSVSRASSSFDWFAVF